MPGKGRHHVYRESFSGVCSLSTAREGEIGKNPPPTPSVWSLDLAAPAVTTCDIHNTKLLQGKGAGASSSVLINQQPDLSNLCKLHKGTCSKKCLIIQWLIKNEISVLFRCQ